MTLDRNDPRWTAYVLGELDEPERVEFEREIESVSDAEAILAETRDTLTLLREGFASEQPVYLSAEQKRAIEAEAAPRIPWFRSRLQWAAGLAVAAVLLMGVVTITVPNLLRTRQTDDARAVASNAETPRAVTQPAIDSPASGLDADDPMESGNGVRESAARVSELTPPETQAAPNMERAQTTQTDPAGVRPPVPSEPVEESQRMPRRLTARVQGQVIDSAGAILPGAEVTLTSDATGQLRRDYTDDAGTYNFPILRARSYTAQISLPGFRTETRSGIQVERERNARIDFELEVGQVATPLQASAPPPPPPPPGTPAGAAEIRGVTGGIIGAQGSTVEGQLFPVRRFAAITDEIAQPRFNTEEYNRVVDNPFVAVLKDPLATFSIDVDTAAYANVRRFLNQRDMPPPDAVRIEEMVNYFTYDYAGPAGEHPVRVHAEVAAAPWNPEHRLVRLGVQGREVPLEERAPSNLVFLIDVSGSMADANKLPLLRDGMKLLVEQLDEDDRVAIVVYAGASGMVLPSTPGDQKPRLLRALDHLEAGGSTNGGAGIELAYDTAVDHFIEGGTNRVILATDGDFNVGVTDNGALTRLIEQKAETGVFLSVLGFGTGNYNDAGLEALADYGNGNYAYIDAIREARKVLVEQMDSTLITIAKDVKIQVEFNPAKVNAYRLIGYENRVLKHQDFNDDTKDAGEIGSGHTVTALFEVVPAGADMPLPGVDPLRYQTPSRLSGAASRGELLTVKLRYQEPAGEVSRLMEVAVTDRGAPLAEASTDYRFAAAVAGLGMILRDSPHLGSATLESVLRLAEASLGTDEEGYRAEFVELVRKAGKITLHVAVGNENLAVIEALIEAGADLEARGDDDHTPLHVAVGNENLAVIEALLNAGADPMARDDNGRTPLHVAARDSGNPVVIQALLAAGAEVDARADGDWTPLHVAVRNENLAVIEALLNAGADPTARDDDGRTPLHVAAAWYNGNPAVIEALIEAGADLEARGDDDHTPLHVAVGNENLAVIEALLNAGADPMARGDDGRTPLHVVARDSEDPVVIQALLAAGAEVDARADGDWTPLHWAARDSENPAVIEALLDAGADLMARGDYGETPLHWAVGNENPAVIEALLDAGADLMARDDYGETPLHWAAWNENPAVVQALLAAGADPAARGEEGHTPLHVAAGANANPAVIEALLDAGGDPAARDTASETPLHWAARDSENPAVIETLLTDGADVTAPNAAGETPWDLAQENERLRDTDAYRRLNNARFDRP